MKRVLKVIFLFSCISLLGGCDIESSGSNFKFVTLRIVDVELPESFDINGFYDIQVTYERPNGCTFFEGFDVTRVDQNTRDVVAIGTEFIDDMACTQAIEEVVANFQFEVVYSGPYTFRFFNGTDANGNPVYLEYVVEVNSTLSD